MVTATVEMEFIDVHCASQMLCIPESGIRHLIFSNEEFNNKVVRRIGRKVLLDREALRAFIQEEGQKQRR